MTVDVAEQFLFLSEDASRIRETSLLTRAVGVHVRGGDVLAALDVAKLRHLLIPLIDEDEMVEDRHGGPVELTVRELQTAEGPRRFADLFCRDSSLELVFERLVDDVATQLQASPHRPVHRTHRVLAEWRALLRSASQGIGRETAVGLVGELEILRQLAGSASPAAALAAWRGPTGAIHDFMRSGRAIEVKSTASVDGNFVEISNVDQLDPGSEDKLHLAVVHLREDTTGPSIDERIDELVALGVPKRQLIDQVAGTGHVYESGSAEVHRYSVRSIRVWAVNSLFPGLRRSDLSEDRLRGVARIRYELALDSAPPPMRQQIAVDLLNGWIRR